MGSKKVAIIQSSYIPWKGFFDIIASVDEFILYDDAQFTKRDWRNRNKIKTPQGLQWLTVPVDTKGKFHQKIKDTLITDPSWQADHWKSIHHNYAGTPGYSSTEAWLKPLFLGTTYKSISEVNETMTREICRQLGITTQITQSMDYQIQQEDPTAKLLELCLQAGATTYISGPSAMDYMQTDSFAAQNIQVEFFNYSGYPEYPQKHGAFEHGVSIVDLFFNVGPAAKEFFRRRN